MKSTDSEDYELKNERKTLRISRRFCPHCQQTLSYKTYRIHKRMHYDVARSMWHKQDNESPLPSVFPQDLELSPPQVISPPAVVTPVQGYSLIESPPNFHDDDYTIDSIVKGLETAHVRPLKRVRTPRAILVTSCYELSQFRAPEKERTR